MRTRWLVIVALVVTASCTDIIPATREDAYEFRTEYATTEFSYQWPISAMPLRIWVDPAGPLYQPTQTGISRWENAVLYGEFRGVIVSDSNTADIIMHNAPPDLGNSRFALNLMAPQCTGETDQNIDFDARTLTLPILIYVYPNGNQDPAALATCYRITATHELGHALGILVHSPNPADIMYLHPIVDALSAADKETMELIFHSIPNLTILGSQCPITELCSSVRQSTLGNITQPIVRRANSANAPPRSPHTNAAPHLENR